MAEEDGEVAGFHGLSVEEDWVELHSLFVTLDRIGDGYGKEIWLHAVDEAVLSGDRMRILSDPGALWFYEKMGAKLEKQLEVAPGFFLGLYWYDLTLAKTKG